MECIQSFNAEHTSFFPKINITNLYCTELLRSRSALCAMLTREFLLLYRQHSELFIAIITLSPPYIHPLRICTVVTPILQMRKLKDNSRRTGLQSRQSNFRAHCLLNSRCQRLASFILAFGFKFCVNFWYF